jgi:hypothetical protein
MPFTFASPKYNGGSDSFGRKEILKDDQIPKTKKG